MNANEPNASNLNTLTKKKKKNISSLTKKTCKQSSWPRVVYIFYRMNSYFLTGDQSSNLIILVKNVIKCMYTDKKYNKKAYRQISLFFEHTNDLKVSPYGKFYR